MDGVPRSYRREARQEAAALPPCAPVAGVAAAEVLSDQPLAIPVASMAWRRAAGEEALVASAWAPQAVKVGAPVWAHQAVEDAPASAQFAAQVAWA
jgi:hypothetical protein